MAGAAKHSRQKIIATVLFGVALPGCWLASLSALSSLVT
jgi:purine-cytosine permease-like protein